MQLPLMVLGVVALASSVCASRYHFPASVYWLDLKEPHEIELATGENVPCGRGLVMAAYDRLLSCKIDRRATIELHEFPAGAELEFRFDASLEHAAYVEREGTLVHGEGFRVMRVMSFDSSGNVTTSSKVERSQGTVAEPVPPVATAK